MASIGIWMTMMMMFLACNGVSAFVPSLTNMPSIVFRTSSDSSPVLASSSAAAASIPETRPLPPHTFAGMVEAGIMERYGSDSVDRVLQSWRLLEAGYEHKVPVEHLPPAPTGTKYASIATQDDKTMCVQQSHSYVPGLTIQPFWPDQPWQKKMESKYSAIRDEFLRVTQDSSTLQQQGNNIWAGALTDDASSYGVGWKTLVLMDRGYWDPVNVNLFPKAAKAIRDANVPATEVFFASMEPHSEIAPHSDFTNFVLTSHLALDIPYSGENQCRLTIADQTKEWINGECTLFDTSLLHDAVNESDQKRYILMMRVWHPDLSQDERGALQFIYDCLNNPDIVSADSPEKRRNAEELMQQMREFPMLLKGVGPKKAGFGGGSSEKKKASKKKRKK